VLLRPRVRSPPPLCFRIHSWHGSWRETPSRRSEGGWVRPDSRPATMSPLRPLQWPATPRPRSPRRTSGGRPGDTFRNGGKKASSCAPESGWGSTPTPPLRFDSSGAPPPSPAARASTARYPAEPLSEGSPRLPRCLRPHRLRPLNAPRPPADPLRHKLRWAGKAEGTYLYYGLHKNSKYFIIKSLCGCNVIASRA